VPASRPNHDPLRASDRHDPSCLDQVMLEVGPFSTDDLTSLYSPKPVCIFLKHHKLDSISNIKYILFKIDIFKLSNKNLR
jgi:hypothetical protein